MKDKKAFTLIELLVSISISSIVIFWFTQIFMNIQDSLNFSQQKSIIFNDIRDFSTKLSYTTSNYNSWFIISQENKFDTLILTNTWNIDWYLIWVFDCSNKTWLNIELASNNTIYNNNCFWYFPLKQSQILAIIADNWSIYNNSFNAWKIYENLIVKDLKILKFSPNYIFDLNFEFFDNFYSELINKIITNLNYDKSKIITVNINL